MASDTHLSSGGSAARNAVSPEEAAKLEAPAARKVLKPAVAHGITDMQPIGFSRISRTPHVVTGETSDWLILPAELDPLFQQGQLAAPPEARARITELLDAGIWFDAVAIAHQVPRGALAYVKNSEELQRLLEPPTPKSLSVFSNVIGTITAGASLVGELVAHLTARSLDPMIFGAVVANPPAKDGDAALFFLVTRWDY